MSCTFGVLLAVIAQAQATASFAGLLLVFATYAAGSATLLLLLALMTGLAGAALTRQASTLARYGPRATAAVLLLTGAYLAWYWYPAATGGHVTGGNGLVRASVTATTWIQGRTTLLAAIAVVAVVAIMAAALRYRLRATR